MAVGAAFMGAVSALYDKWLLGRYEPLEVQAWYSFYQFVIMGITIALILRGHRMRGEAVTPFRWRWTILFISLFLTAADIAYFYALSLPGAMIAVVSMIRRGSVVVSFFYGVIALRGTSCPRQADRPMCAYRRPCAACHRLDVGLSQSG